jgi:hypothetical protein
LLPILRDASLHDAPQDEVFCETVSFESFIRAVKFGIGDEVKWMVARSATLIPQMREII